MEKSKSIGRKILFNLLTLVILLYLFLIFITMIMAVLEYKINVTGDIIIEKALSTAAHPVKFVADAISEKNPLVILGGCFIVGYSVYFQLKRLAKRSAWQVDDSETHGSARWENKKALLHSGSGKLIKQEQFHREWLATLKKGELP